MSSVEKIHSWEELQMTLIEKIQELEAKIDREIADMDSLRARINLLETLIGSEIPENSMETEINGKIKRGKGRPKKHIEDEEKKSSMKYIIKRDDVDGNVYFNGNYSHAWPQFVRYEKDARKYNSEQEAYKEIRSGARFKAMSNVDIIEAQL
jgi:hypothetical protein